MSDIAVFGQNLSPAVLLVCGVVLGLLVAKLLHFLRVVQRLARTAMLLAVTGGVSAGGGWAALGELARLRG